MMTTKELIERLMIKRESLKRDKLMFKFDDLTANAYDVEIMITNECIEKLTTLSSIEFSIDAYFKELEDDLNIFKREFEGIFEDHGKE